VRNKHGDIVQDPAWQQTDPPEQEEQEYCRRCFAPIDDAGIGWSGGSTACLPKGADSVTVSQLNGQTVCQHFSLKQLYDEIKQGVEQPRLF
jgi:hypothetical protein